jgi:LysM repeat protein
MPRVAALAVLLLAVATACGDDGEVAVEMRTSQTSTTFVTLPIPSTTRPPVTQPNRGDADDDGPGGERDDEPEEDPNAERSYEVRSGDFLFRIATAHDVTPEALVAYNGWEGLNHHINPGEVIRIPPVNWDPDNPDGNADEPDATAPDESAAPGEQCPDGSEAETYELRRGDTPGRLAARFDTTVADLEAANAETPNYANFVVGTVIKLPC